MRFEAHVVENDVVKAVEALTLIGGYVGEEILLRNEFLAAENEILRSKLGARVDLTNAERIRLAKLGRGSAKRHCMAWLKAIDEIAMCKERVLQERATTSARRSS